MNWSLVLRLAPAGIIGGIAGAVAVSYLPIGIIKPVVSAYLLLMGVFVITLAFRKAPEKPVSRNSGRSRWSGRRLSRCGRRRRGGGRSRPRLCSAAATHRAKRWAALTCLSSSSPRRSRRTFFLTLGGVRWTDIAGLIIGGVLAAPIAAFAVSVARPRLLMGVIGCFVSSLALWQIAVAIDPNMTFVTTLTAMGRRLGRD